MGSMKEVREVSCKQMQKLVFREFVLLVITQEQMYVWAENKTKRTELWFRLKRLIFTCRLIPYLPIDR